MKFCCLICNSNFIAKLCAKRKFCSRNCYYIYRTGKPRKPHTIESRIKISKALSGKNNGNYTHGKCLTKSYCVDCNKELSDYRKKRCGSCAQSGRLNHRWNEGSSYKGYPSIFNYKLRQEIRLRDNFECYICRIKQWNLSIKLDVHHINYDKNDCNKDNLISLCHPCHSKTHSNREYWLNYFKEINNAYLRNK